MRNAEWPSHVSFIGIVSLVICLFAGNVSYLPSCLPALSSARIANPATMPENSCPGIALDRVG
jgi:hypothetical protein